MVFFELLKECVFYFCGFDYKGGWKMGGYSSGDVFVIGVDMMEYEKINNILID